MADDGREGEQGTSGTTELDASGQIVSTRGRDGSMSYLDFTDYRAATRTFGTLLASGVPILQK